jgi:hypothetical protein
MFVLNKFIEKCFIYNKMCNQCWVCRKATYCEYLLHEFPHGLGSWVCSKTCWALMESKPSGYYPHGWTSNPELEKYFDIRVNIKSIMKSVLNGNYQIHGKLTTPKEND